MPAPTRVAALAHFPAISVAPTNQAPPVSTSSTGPLLLPIIPSKNDRQVPPRPPFEFATAATQSEIPPAGNTSPAGTALPAPVRVTPHSSRRLPAHPLGKHPNSPTAVLRHSAEIAAVSPACSAATHPPHPETTFRPAPRESFPISIARRR